LLLDANHVDDTGQIYQIRRFVRLGDLSDWGDLSDCGDLFGEILSDWGDLSDWRLTRKSRLTFFTLFDFICNMSKSDFSSVFTNI
jgi:hypothetical protein